MAKTKAQRMHEYRERKKAKLGNRWLKAERERVKSYYVPLSKQDSNTRKRTREGNKQRQARFRAKRKVVEQAHIEIQNDNEQEHREDMVTSTTGTPLTVKLPFPTTSRSTSGTKRKFRALAKSYRRIETLQDKMEDLKN